MDFIWEGSWKLEQMFTLSKGEGCWKEMKKNCAPKSMGECALRELRREKLKSLEKCQPILKEKVIEERKKGKNIHLLESKGRLGKKR